MSNLSFREKVRFITNCFAADGRVKGWFTGSAYQFHPHGFCVNSVLIYDHHNVNDYQTIEVANTPGKGFYPAEDAPTAWNADALPRFVGGQTTVWSSGSWQQEGAFVEKIEQLVDYLYTECKKAVEAKKIVQENKRLALKIEKESKEKELSKAWED